MFEEPWMPFIERRLSISIRSYSEFQLRLLKWFQWNVDIIENPILERNRTLKRFFEFYNVNKSNELCPRVANRVNLTQTKDVVYADFLSPSKCPVTLRVRTTNFVVTTAWQSTPSELPAIVVNNSQQGLQVRCSEMLWDAVRCSNLDRRFMLLMLSCSRFWRMPIAS